jgi:alkylated DNA nucleotide flippase Atl1
VSGRPAAWGGPRPSRSDRQVGVSGYEQRVLDVVGLIPAGRVLTYGDIARLVPGGGPRQVGRVMSRWSDGVPWHRVVYADGTPASCHGGDAFELLRGERTAMRGGRVDLPRARWDSGQTGTSAAGGRG